jgi:hypothetical protein
MSDGIAVWRALDIEKRFNRYVARERTVRLGRSVTVARCGMMTCAAAITALQDGPRLVSAPGEWGWPNALDSDRAI